MRSYHRFMRRERRSSFLSNFQAVVELVRNKNNLCQILWCTVYTVVTECWLLYNISRKKWRRNNYKASSGLAVLWVPRRIFISIMNLTVIYLPSLNGSKLQSRLPHFHYQICQVRALYIWVGKCSGRKTLLKVISLFLRVLSLE